MSRGVLDAGEPVYAIAVAARLTRMHPQTLRKYERAGLVRPARTLGDQRLYSAADLRRLTRIRHLVEDRGVNVAGLELALAMVDRLGRLPRDSSMEQMWGAIDEVIGMGDAAA
jgi:MerR family transcriptional regulator/heat shock protein HspR